MLKNNNDLSDYFEYFPDVEIQEETSELLEIFRNGIINKDKDGVSYLQIDYIDDYKDWERILIFVNRIFDKCGFKFVRSEFAHTLRFVYILCRPNEKINPHADYNVRQFASLNIPLRGKCQVDFYEDLPQGIDSSKDSIHMGLQHYENPILLNTNKVHGVKNNTNEDRIVLKVIFFLHSFELLKQSLVEEVRIFDSIPWYGRGKLASILGETKI